MTTIGILGAGKVGTVLAGLAARSGYRTLIAASGDPAQIELIVEVLSPGTTAASSEEVARAADVVILAIPLGRLHTIPRAALAGKIVIDAMNYWPPTDGMLEQFERDGASSAVVAASLPDSLVVKALNHLGYHELEQDSRPAGAADRHAIAIAGDDEDAVRAVADIVDRLGFDPVIAGTLGEGARFGPGTELFGVSTTRAEVERLLAPAVSPSTRRSA